MIEASNSSLSSKIIEVSLLIDSNSMYFSNSIGQLSKIEFLVKNIEVALVE